MVSLLGARQVGKSTLVRMLVEAGWSAEVLSLDDFDLLSMATHDPQGFVDGLAGPTVIDEVQRAPDLLRAVKRVVDRERRHGSFLLTGSANLLTMKGISESLAGRVRPFELLPLSLAEILRAEVPSKTLEVLFSATSARDVLEALPPTEVLPDRQELLDRVLEGGYPDAVRAPSADVRAEWFEAYRRTYLERDLRDIARVRDLVSFGQLLTAVAATSGELLNASRLSRDLGIQLNTVRRHLDLLEVTYQIFRIAPYQVNVRRRVVKTPKLHFSDTGLACHLIGARDHDTLDLLGRTGALVETWVATELRKLCALSIPATELYFWRTHGGDEVDFVLSRGIRLVGIEVKLAHTLRAEDLAGLRRLREAVGDRLGPCIVVHGGRRRYAPLPWVAAIPLGDLLAGGSSPPTRRS